MKGGSKYLFLFAGAISFSIWIAKVLIPVIQNTGFHRVEGSVLILVRIITNWRYYLFGTILLVTTHKWQIGIGTPVFTTHQAYLQYPLSNRLVCRTYLIFCIIYWTCGYIPFFNLPPLFVIILLFYYIFLFWVNSNGMGRQLFFLSTTALFCFLHWNPLLVILFLLYYIWLICVNINSLGKHLLLLPVNKFFSVFHCTPILVILFYSTFLHQH